MFEGGEGEEALPDNRAGDPGVHQEHVPDSGAFDVGELAVFPHPGCLIS